MQTLLLTNLSLLTTLLLFLLCLMIFTYCNQYLARNHQRAVAIHNIEEQCGLNHIISPSQPVNTLAETVQLFADTVGCDLLLHEMDPRFRI